MTTRNCSSCSNWVDSFCRASGPTPLPDGSSVWPRTLPTDWCFRFKFAVKKVGYDRKFTDEQVVEMVRVYDSPMIKDDGEELPPQAVKRTDLVWTIKNDFGVSSTPALARIEKLVRRGILKMGPNPYPTENPAPGIYVWLGDSTPTTSEPRKPKAEFLDLLRGIAPDSSSPLSVRAIRDQINPILPLSSTSVHRKLQTLVSAGHVIFGPEGYYVA